MGYGCLLLFKGVVYRLVLGMVRKNNWKKETRFKDLFVKMKMRAYINDRIKGKIIEIYI